jgi:hypothetical protein
MRDCCKKSIAKIPDDEPVFCLFGRDRLAKAVVRFWIDEAERAGVNHDKILRAKGHLKDMEDFELQHSDRVKLPD